MTKFHEHGSAVLCCAVQWCRACREPAASEMDGSGDLLDPRHAHPGGQGVAGSDHVPGGGRWPGPRMHRCGPVVRLCWRRARREPIKPAHPIRPPASGSGLPPLAARPVGPLRALERLLPNVTCDNRGRSLAGTKEEKDTAGVTTAQRKRGNVAAGCRARRHVSK